MRKLVWHNLQHQNNDYKSKILLHGYLYFKALKIIINKPVNNLHCTTWDGGKVGDWQSLIMSLVFCSYYNNFKIMIIDILLNLHFVMKWLPYSNYLFASICFQSSNTQKLVFPSVLSIVQCEVHLQENAGLMLLGKLWRSTTIFLNILC